MCFINLEKWKDMFNLSPLWQGSPDKGQGQEVCHSTIFQGTQNWQVTLESCPWELTASWTQAVSGGGGRAQSQGVG